MPALLQPAAVPSALAAFRPRARPQSVRLAARTALAAQATAQQQVALAFHPSSDTTISFPLRADEAQKLAAALTGVMQTFAEKQSAERPKRWPSMEYKFKGDTAAGEVELLEVVCNPNAHVTAFDARALVTLRTAGGLRVTTEGKLTAIKADVDEYVAALGQAQ